MERQMGIQKASYLNSFYFVEIHVHFMFTVISLYLVNKCIWRN